MSNPAPTKRLALLAGSIQSGESREAILACNDWLRLGPGRSLPALAAKYTKTHRTTPPTRSLDTLKEWSARWGWAERAEAYDAADEARKNARRQQALDEGLALDYERVGELKRLARLLRAQIYERGLNHAGDKVYHNLWVEDVKQIGSGETARPVYVERFNGALISEFRGVLKDLAEETGGRQTAPERPPPPPREAGLDLTQLTDDELACFHQLARKAAARNGV